MKFFSSLLILLLLTGLAGTAVLAQSKTITGRVLSDDGKPLPNVSVTVKGGTTGVQSQADGSFTIAAVPNDVLVFSFIGYGSQEQKVGNRASIDVALKASAGTQLDDVVVVGYGTQSRKSITSSIGKLDNRVLETAPVANVATSLQGAVAGIKVVNASGTPGAQPSIFLRGGASINAPAPPLIVVDGVVRPSLNDIPAGDIASMELLRDAASTAIYGARANNGVILVTTKQGKAGKAQVNYKFTEGYNENRKGYSYMNAHDYIYYNRLGNLNAGVSLTAVNTRRGYGLLTDAADLASFDIKAYSGGALAPGWVTVSDPYGPSGSHSGVIAFKDHNGEIYNALFHNTHTQEHFVDVVAGNDKGKFYSSFDYFKQDGIIVGSN